MDFRKSEEHLAIEASVEKFARQEMAPLAKELDEKGEFSMELWKKMGSLGYCGLLVDEKYGGSNLGALGTVLALQAAGRGGADQGTCLSWASHMVIASLNIQTWGTEEQKEKYLPRMASGEWIGAMALTEPGAGSDASSITTRAVRKGDKYILNGTKMFITNGPICDIGIVLAVTDPSKGPLGISAFIFEKDFPGFSRGKKIDKMGMRSSPTSELIFEDCIIPEENLLGGEGMGALVANTTLHWERTGMGFAIGTMEYNLNLCKEYALQRYQFGEPIGNFQAVRHRLAEMKIDIEAAKCLFYRMAWLIDTDQIPAILDISVGKAFLSKALVKNADAAISIFGGYGVCSEYPVQRSYRDAKIIEIGGGTYDIQLNMIAAAIMGPRQKVKKK
ncbi:MAG: acyl-CoA dehydrogenase [Syntrophomonadaceae bacterium]|nr:acyl-CoA dehydrogenase [Syntrophomonadaceae bacterium]